MSRESQRRFHRLHLTIFDVDMGFGGLTGVLWDIGVSP